MSNYIKILLPIIISFVISFIISKPVIPILYRLKFGQEIREEGPKSHLKKAGTPTMGGFIFIISIVITSLIYITKDMKILYPLLSMILFGIVGFVDDYNKVINKRNLGLTAKQKLVFQFLIGLILAVIIYKIHGGNTSIYVPFMPVMIELKLLYIPFVMLTMVASSNAVNLTDGLDGLAAGVTAIVMIFFGIIGYRFGYVPASIFSFIVAGSLVGFLRVNKNPAKCFMGDTGSMALGGAVSGGAIYMNMPLLILIIGLPYLLETLSVMIQVVYFKKTNGKRFFKMAPFHHHLELSGYTEVQVVNIFYIFTIICSIIGFISTKFM